MTSYEPVPFPAMRIVLARFIGRYLSLPAEGLVPDPLPSSIRARGSSNAQVSPFYLKSHNDNVMPLSSCNGGARSIQEMLS